MIVLHAAMWRGYGDYSNVGGPHRHVACVLASKPHEDKPTIRDTVSCSTSCIRYERSQCNWTTQQLALLSSTASALLCLNAFFVTTSSNADYLAQRPDLMKATRTATRSPGPQPWVPDLENRNNGASGSSGDLVVVIATHPKAQEDLSWLKLQPYDYVLMTKMAGPQGDNGIHNLNVNYGGDASSYLQFILAHWDHLPERIAFMHGHWYSWHTWVSRCPSLTRLVSSVTSM